MYSLSSFDVSRFNQNFRLSVRFGELTEPEEFFRFHNHSELLGLANTILSFQVIHLLSVSLILTAVYVFKCQFCRHWRDHSNQEYYQ